MKLDLKSTANRRIIDFKKMGFRQLLVLGRYNYTRSQRELAEHRHPGMLEICYYDKGSQIFEVETNRYLVRGGDVFLHYPGEKHSSGGNPEEKGKLYWMILSLPPALEKKIGENDVNYMCSRLIQSGNRHFKGSSLLKRTLEDIFTACAAKEDKSIVFIKVKVRLRLFLLELLTCAERGEKATDHTRINNVLAYIDDHIDENISILELSKEINLSESRFKSFFKEVTGSTPGDYIQRKKIEKAIEMIKCHPEWPFGEIAYQLNFSSPQYFSTVIKKYTGCSPGQLKMNIEKF